MTAPWIQKMFERFGERLEKELGAQGLDRIDGVAGRRDPFPIEHHGGWEWVFSAVRLRPKDSPLNRYLTLRLTFVPAASRGARTPTPADPEDAAMNVLISVGADNETRFVRREIGEVPAMTERDLRTWTELFAGTLNRALAALWALSEADLDEEYIRRPSRRF